MIDSTVNEKLRKCYNPDGSLLRQHQLRMLEMLKYIDEICKKNNIKYWLSSGTLLGAVRHGGFIPWDDDLDIEMLRKDYKRFINVIADSKSKQFILQSHANDRRYFLPFIKLRDTKSELSEGTIKGKEYKYRGIFVDIFPLDYNCHFLMVLSERLLAVVIKISQCKSNLGGWKYLTTNLLYFIECNFLFPLFRIISYCIASKKEVGHTYGLPFFKKRKLEDIFPLTAIRFENYIFPCPGNYDSYLKRLYGENYLNLPPIVDRKGEHSLNLRFFE